MTNIRARRLVSDDSAYGFIPILAAKVATDLLKKKQPEQQQVVVIPPPPEPSAMTLAVISLFGLGLGAAAGYMFRKKTG